MRILMLLLCSISFLQTSAYAVPAVSFANGSWVGNGGIVARCPSDLEATTLLDLVEGGASPDEWIFPAGSMMEKVTAFIARIARFSPERAELYTTLAANFPRNALMSDDLADTKDIGSLQIPADCTTAQAAMQYSFSAPEHNQYFINATIWDQLTEDMKAVLILHEIIYYDASLMGHMKNASFVRSYVRAIVEDKFKDMNNEQYLEFMKSLHLELTSWIDPQTGKKWLLTSRVNREAPSITLGCKAFTGFTLPLQQELKEAAPRLFASPAAKSFALDDTDLAFWIYDDTGSFLKTMDYQGHEVGSTLVSGFFNLLGVGVCRSL